MHGRRALAARGEDTLSTNDEIHLHCAKRTLVRLPSKWGRGARLPYTPRAAMAARSPELEVGAAVAGTRYRVVKSLGAGGMGFVYQVVKPPNIQGVLKLMSPELTKHEELRLRFFDEVRILAQLDHPNIVRVFDYDALPDGTPFYVMEVLTGRTVRDVLNTLGRVPPRVAYEITRQLLEAVQAAHTHEVPVIHRDIKPENIFLHAPRHGEPIVKLIDFGVSAVADRKHDHAFVGTWSYAAPEQIRGAKPTPATDIYAVGLVLYEMLAGVGPFDHHEDWQKVSKAQLEEIPAPVSRFAPWVPPSIVALIQSTLEKDPKKRPHDAYAFSERLFDLEWASDGTDPNGASHPAEGAKPLSRVLTSVGSAKASSKKMAAASPANDRLGDVPLIGVPPEFVRAGPTWQGMGGEATSPGAESLLAGLDAPQGKPLSKRDLESNPEPPGTPRAGQVVIKAGRNASDTREQVAPTTPRHLPRDTFASQEADAPRPSPRRPLLALGVAVVLGGVAAAAIVAFGAPRAGPSTSTHSPPPSLASSAPAPAVVVSSAPSASSSNGPSPSASTPRPKTTAPPSTRMPASRNSEFLPNL